MVYPDFASRRGPVVLAFLPGRLSSPHALSMSPAADRPPTAASGASWRDFETGSLTLSPHDIARLAQQLLGISYSSLPAAAGNGLTIHAKPLPRGRSLLLHSAIPA